DVVEIHHQFDNLFHFVFSHSNFDGHVLELHIHDLGSENICNLHDFSARFRVHRNFDQYQLAVHIFALAEINHLQHVHQLVELLDDLFQRRVVTARHDGHARRAGVLRRRDVERVDVVTASAEQSGDAREETELVFHHKGDGGSHNAY